MIVIDPTWQIKHFWRVSPNRNEITKVLTELKIILGKAVQLELASKVYLTSDELLRNSLEHGCLKIGNQRKEELLEAGTFEEFFNNCEKSLKGDSTHWIELTLELEDKLLKLTVKDSGDGYSLAPENEKSLDITRLSNRGLEIVKGMGSKLSVQNNPTQTTVSFNLS